MKTKTLLTQASDYLIYVTDKPDIIITKGNNMYLWDIEGNKYLDFIGGWGVTSLGHCHPIIKKALKKQSRKLITASPSFYNEEQIKFAKLLIDNSCMDKVFFTSTGAEANECAIKIARKYGIKHKNGAYEIITTINSFHGRTLATMSASGKEQFKNLYEPKVGGFIQVEYNNIEAIKEKINEKTIAVMIEPIQGEGGIITSEKDYIKKLRKLCSDNNILLIFDEIQTGIGRTGKLFCYEHYDIEPDIITLAKGIGGGYPLSACLSKEKYCVFDAGDQGGTYTGQPLGMAVGYAIVSYIIKKTICNHVKLIGKYLFKRLKELEKLKKISNIRGMGLLIAFDVTNLTGQEVFSLCLKKGLLLNSPKPKTIRLFPSFTIQKKHVDKMISILNDIL